MFLIRSKGTISWLGWSCKKSCQSADKRFSGEERRGEERRGEERRGKVRRGEERRGKEIIPGNGTIWLANWQNTYVDTPTRDFREMRKLPKRVCVCIFCVWVHPSVCRCTSTQYAHYTIGVSATGPLQSISVSNSETALGTSFSHTRVTAPSSHSQSTGRKKKEKKKKKRTASSWEFQSALWERGLYVQRDSKTGIHH